MTPTGTTNSPAPPEATGYETDKMSRPHIEAHFDNFIGQILERIPAKDRKAFKVVVEDSYETGGQNFTDDFLESFRKRYGYDPLPYLPAYYGYVVNRPKRRTVSCGMCAVWWPTGSLTTMWRACARRVISMV